MSEQATRRKSGVSAWRHNRSFDRKRLRGLMREPQTPGVAPLRGRTLKRELRKKMKGWSQNTGARKISKARAVQSRSEYLTKLAEEEAKGLG